MAEQTADEQREFSRWLSEIDYAQRDQVYKKWIARSELIIKRYRDDRGEVGADYGRRRYNILWANVQT